MSAAARARAVAIDRAIGPPELAAILVIAAGWIGLVLINLSPMRHFGIDLRASALPGGALDAMAAWALMSAAMMGPTALPAARHTAINSLRRRRHRAVTTFLGAYLAVWVAFGLASMTAVAALRAAGLDRIVPNGVLVLTLAAAAMWQASPWKQSALRSCQRGVPLPPRGWAATIGCLRFGGVLGARCVSSCWALMLVMAAVTASPLLWTIIIGGLIVGERWFPIVRRRRSLAAAGLVGLGTMVALGSGGPGGPDAIWMCLIPS
jgi:predicted metal-binding membrane protein